MPETYPSVALSNSSFVIRNALIVEPSIGISAGDVLIKDGRIAGTGADDITNRSGRVEVDARGRLLTPGLIDLHTHGILDRFYATGREDLLEGGAVLGQFGVTTVLPTIVPRIEAGWLDKIGEVCAALDDVRGVNMPGLHLEGPFMAIKGTAAETIEGDLELLDSILAACGGRLVTMSLSPETPRIIPVIEKLRENEVMVFLTHTCASVEQTEAAIAAGGSHATHFYDVFYSPPETDKGVRPVGAVEAILADQNVTVDFIADGIHVHPAAIRAAVAAKGHRGVTLITDSIVGAGLPPGLYDTPWGFQVRLREGDAPRTVAGNHLAGSSLTMDQGIRNLLSWLDLPPEQVWAMGTSNPADVVGFADVGRIQRGNWADLVLWDEDLRPAQTWVRGESVYRRNQSSIPTLV